MVKQKNENKGKRKPSAEGIKPPFRLTPLHYYLALFAAFFAAILYINTLGHSYVLDDYSAITINRYVQEGVSGIPKLMTVDFWYFSNVQLGYYRPLSLITFAIEYQFAGLSPMVSHLVNILFFALSVYLVFLLISRLFPGKNMLFPLAVTLLFAAHPIHTEVIDNLKGRDELLSFLNTVAMLYFAIRYLDTRKTWRLILALLFFYFALLSKESAMIGIALLPLVIFYTQPGVWTKQVKILLLFAAVLVVFLIQKRLALGPDATVIPNDIVNYPYRDPAVKMPTAFLLFLFSIRLLAFPYPLRYDYSFNYLPAVEWNSLWALGGLVTFMILLVIAIREVKKQRQAGLIIGFFFIAMVPLIAFLILRGGIFAERNLFAASLAFCIGIGFLLEKITGRDLSVHPQKSFRHLLQSGALFLVAVLLIGVVYSLITINRNKAWKDPITLFSTDIRTGGSSAQNQLHYGSEMLEVAKTETNPAVKDSLIDTGKAAIRNALRIYPRFADAMYRYAYANELILTYRPESRYIDSTIIYFNKAIEFSPTLSQAYHHLGIIYEWLQRYDVALYYYNRAYELNPRLLEAKQKADELRATYGLDVRVNPLNQGGSSR